jgi:hypothetical protein
MSDGYRILFGDIHNHNAMGYGIGSMERSIEIARGHLDFFAFTGHSSWHDMVPMEGGREQHWLNGFERLKEGWPHVQNLIADANRDEEFGAFLGFEWHSSGSGDQCVVFPDDHQPIHYAPDIADLRRFCQEKKALMIPHHLAYPTGMRGVNWAVFDPCCTPVVEIFSEHGNSEHDRGGFDYFTHSMGGRVTANTARAALDQGLKFGFVASSDSHNGFPGAYGEGLLAVLSRELNRAAIIEAINARRTYALTGDRIEIDFTVEGATMGADIETGREVEVAYDVAGRDEMDVVEIIQDGHVVHRAYGRDQADGKPFQVRLEWGWGPWGDLALDRIADWVFDLSVGNGKLLRYFPCLQSGPFDEERRHHFETPAENLLRVCSYTARQGAYRLNPNNSVVLELAGGSDLALDLKMTRPSEQTARVTAKELLAGSSNLRTGPFPKEAYQFHRAVPAAASRVAGKVRLPVPEGRSYIYLRARQVNGHIAWASPVFVNYR